VNHHHISAALAQERIADQHREAARARLRRKVIPPDVRKPR
jgi:hypothetical protein